MEEKPFFDVAVVGAGAAGLMAVIWAGKTARAQKAPLKVVALNAGAKIGAKISMSGGTRCNVTNQNVQPSDFEGGPRHFLKHALEAFTPQETIRFFKDIGVELVLKSGGKFFPSTGSSQTVLDALIKEAGRAGGILKTEVRITEVKKTGDVFYLRDSKGACRAQARSVILATGGLSYPATGCDGTGYEIAKSFGHRIVDTVPALTPLLTNDSDWKALSGISLEAKLSFFRDGKKEKECRGSLLFTHFGFSGPPALDISGRAARKKPEERPQIVANFLPDADEQSLRDTFQSAQKKNSKKLIKNFLAEEHSLPNRFVATFIKKIGADGNKPVGAHSNEDRKRLIHFLLHYSLEVTGVLGYQKAEVTAGGVDLRQVNVSTMESKLAKGLYFAGEMLDADGRIGGFNFQWAWSTGAIAGRSAARSVLL